jgi:uncharacterized membrane protein
VTGRPHLGAEVSLVLLIGLTLAWELWIAPLRPGGSWMVLKTLPLLAPLPGVLHGRRRTLQWAALLVLVYFAEGVVRAVAETGRSRWLAATEVALSVTFFLCAIWYVRVTRSDIARPLS